MKSSLRLVLPLLVVAACATAAPAQGPPGPPAPAPRVDAWAGFDANATKYLNQLAGDLDCGNMKEWCDIASGWATAAPAPIPDGPHVIGGLSVALAAGDPTLEAFQRPMVLSLMAVDKDAAGVRVRLVTERPSNASESAEVNDALGWFVGYARGASPGMRLVGGLAAQASALAGRADTPTEEAAHGLRFVLADGTRAEMRRVGKLFVVIEQPPGVDGILLTILTEKIKLEPDGKPGPAAP